MFKSLTDEIFKKLKEGLPEFWDGRESILYMQTHGCRHWRQMEWIGFYFQFMCETLLSSGNYMKVPGPKFGNVEFDGFKDIPWDFKAHCIDRNNPDRGKIPTNGLNESLLAIDVFGNIGFIIISGHSDYDDESLSFKKWHDDLKGGVSDYELARIKRCAKSRRRKINFKPEELIFVFLNKSNINSCGKFQTNFRNSDGSPRNAKVMLDLNNASLKIYRYKFDYV